MSCRTVLLTGGFLFAARLLSAQSSPDSLSKDAAALQAPETWGAATGYTTVMAYQLRGVYSGYLINDIDRTYCLGYPGNYPAAEAWAPLGPIPDGANLSQLQFWAYDDDPNYGLTFEVYETCQTGSSPPATSMIASADTFGAIGYYFGFTPLNGHKVNNRDCRYSVRVVFIPPDVECRDQHLQVHKLQVSWVRQVSPAPATATFGDVPTGHSLFQYVEALAKSGITGGCGSGNFCPGAPLTRGQMSVFLAKGLGLSWP